MIDVDQAILGSLGITMEKNGHELIKATSGRDALEKMRNGKDFDLIVIGNDANTLGRRPEKTVKN